MLVFSLGDDNGKMLLTLCFG